MCMCIYYIWVDNIDNNFIRERDVIDFEKVLLIIN